MSSSDDSMCAQAHIKRLRFPHLANLGPQKSTRKSGFFQVFYDGEIPTHQNIKSRGGTKPHLCPKNRQIGRFNEI